jgi:hypothetical protein
MPGKGTAPSEGAKLEDMVTEIAEAMGLRVRRQVKAGSRLWGNKRRIDILLEHPFSGKVLGIECKVQHTRGTAEEKLPAAVQDIASWPIPGILVIHGAGFSDRMVGFLLSTGRVVQLPDLQDWLRLYFSVRDTEQ